MGYVLHVSICEAYTLIKQHAPVALTREELLRYN